MKKQPVPNRERGSVQGTHQRMTYDETIAYMFRQLPMYQRVGKSAYKADLSTALRLDAFYGHPHQQYATIHVAGTNGKGSVSHMLAAILQVAGYMTGLFTSPHLKDFRERIRVNGAMIPEAEVVEFMGTSEAIFTDTSPSFFEMTSAMALHYFAKARVDIAVIEVGMGGRLDSTNIITPCLSVITNIGYDHTEFLGDTLAGIATEKAGIIKENVPVVIGEYHPETWPVFSARASDKKSKITLAENIYDARNIRSGANYTRIWDIFREGEMAFSGLQTDLSGMYQQKNICTVLAAVDALIALGFGIGQVQLTQALNQVQLLTGLQGRWQVVGRDPLIICDTGHNAEGLRWVVDQIRDVSYRQLHMVIGFVNDKDITHILELLPREALYYFTNAAIPRAMEAGTLQHIAGEAGLSGTSYPSVQRALEAAKHSASAGDLIFVGGSNFVVAEVL